MIWDILEQKIMDAGLGVPGASLFRHAMPFETVQGVMLRAPLTGINVDPHIPGLYKPVLQVIVRHNDPVAGDCYADQVTQALTVIAEENYPATPHRGAVELKVFYPRQLPIQYPRLEGNGFEWSLNFTTAFTIQPLVS